MSTDYRLHFAPDNASLVIRIALTHLHLPHDCILLDRSKMEHQGRAYRALNPLGMIPALETPHGTLFETGAILLWLSDMHEGLLPAPRDGARGDALKWLFFVSNSLHAQLRQIFYAERITHSENTADLRMRLAQSVRKDFSQIETLIAAKTCFGAPACLGLSLYTACLFRFAQLYPPSLPRGWVDPARYPALQNLCAELETLPAVHSAQAAEGLGATPFSAPHYANPPIGSAT